MAGIANPGFTKIENRSSINLELSIELSKESEDNTKEAKERHFNDNYIEGGETMTEESKVDYCLSKYRNLRKYLGIFAVNIIVLIYFIFATLHWSKNNTHCNLEWCGGYGMLVLVIAIIYLSLCYYFFIKKYFFKPLKKILRPVSLFLDSINQRRYAHCSLKIIFYAAILVIFIAFLIYDTIGSRERLISGIGVIVLLVLGFVFSKHPRQINWRPVIWGMILQFGFGLITIRWSVGRTILQCMADKVETFLGFSQHGSIFLFSEQLRHVFAFSVLPVIFFFSFMIQILYYLGAMQWIIIKLGWLLHAIMDTTVCESINTAANIFFGMTEAPLLIRPYISKLTSSEIHSIMCSGFATVSGTVLAAYISFGADPAHLLTATVMSAPAALCYAKLFYPETEKSQTTFKNIPIEKSEDVNVLDAATKGALAAIPLVLGIVANIVAFISFVAFFNGLLSWFGGLVGFPELTFEFILSKAFMPLSWIMGVPWDQCEDVATLIGLKTVVNEFIAYQKLGEFKSAGRLSLRAEGIATYAICGFSNPGTVGMMMGFLGSIAPEKGDQIANVAFRAFIAGSAVCFMTAAIAGVLMTDDFYNPKNLNSTTSSNF